MIVKELIEEFERFDDELEVEVNVGGCTYDIGVVNLIGEDSNNPRVVIF